jgi:hypothetical protein
MISEVRKDYADGFYLSRYVRRFVTPGHAAAECLAAIATLKIDRSNVIGGVTEAAMDSELGPMRAGRLLVYGIPLAFEPLQGPGLAWVDFPNAPLPP